MKRIVTALCLIVAMVFSTVVCFADSTSDMAPVLTITAGPEIVPVIVTPAPAPVSRQTVIKALWEMAGSPVVNFILRQPCRRSNHHID